MVSDNERLRARAASAWWVAVTLATLAVSAWLRTPRVQYLALGGAATMAAAWLVGRRERRSSWMWAVVASLGIAHLVGLQGAALQAGVLQTSMPTAVITTILAVEFDVVPDFVTSVVFVSTLLSPLTVTLMIAYLQAV